MCKLSENITIKLQFLLKFRYAGNRASLSCARI